jgi:hypothetical protein
MLGAMGNDPRQVPTLPVLVDLDLTTGKTTRGTFFLSITSSLRAGPETLDEFLNTQRRLMPVYDDARAKSDLVTRDAIVMVRVMSEIAPRPDDVAPNIDLVHVELTNGKTIDGAVQHAQGARLSDFFNSAPDFFALEDGAGVVYVNKRHVIAINI